MEKKQLDLLNAPAEVMEAIGTKEYSNFNIFKEVVDEAIKANKLKITPAEKNTVPNAGSWYHAGIKR